MAGERQRVPVSIINFNVYYGNSRLIGVGDEATLPSCSQMSSEVSGAGVGGTIDMPVVGHFDSMTCSIKFRSVERDAELLQQRGRHDLVFRGAQQVFDGAGGQVNVEGFVAFVGVISKGTELGTLKVGAPIDRSKEFEVVYYRELLNGEELLEIDKLNMVYRVRGVDQLSDVRRNI